MPATLQEITATYLRDRHRFPGITGDTIIGDAICGANGQSQPVVVKGVADDDGPLPHQVYRFYGTFQAYRNPRSGISEQQFNFRTFVRNTPHSRAGVVGYLDKAPGIGRVLAARLFDKFNSSAVQILRDQPEVAAAAVDRLSVEAATGAALWLAEQKQLEDCTMDLIDLLEGRGFRKSISKDAVKKWGNRAAEVIKKNPYRLMQFSGAGFKLCDNLYCELGLPINAMKRQAMCVGHAIRSNTSGNTWNYAGVAEQGLKASISGADVDFPKATRLASRAGMIASVYTEGRDGWPSWDGDYQWLALASKACNEAEVARLLAAANSDSPFPIGPLFDRGVSDHQVEKLITATSGGSVGILGGSPGTGKTYTAAAYIKLIAQYEGYAAICVAAPTGKAAVRITEALALNSVPLRARTIHSLLGVSQVDEGGWRFTHNESNPLPFRYILVDEASMVDTDLMRSLLAARANGSFILFVGDVNQLPPVGHGAPLRDMIAAGLPYGELREIHRNDGGIVQACADMRDGKAFECGGNLIERDPAQETYEGDPVEDYAKAQIQETLNTLDRMTASGINAAWDCQILVAVNRKSALSRREVNKVLQSHLNAKNPEIDGSPFRMLDKVVNLKNRFYPAANDADGASNYGDDLTTNEAGEIYVANGEIGCVSKIEPKYFEVRLQNPTRQIRVPRGAVDPSPDADAEESTGSGCDWDLAYALSCHKSQGSEFSYVIVLIDEYPGARQVCDRAWLYTAISRAKSACFLIGKLSTAQRFCRTNNITRRKTFLRELLIKQITKTRNDATQRALAESAIQSPIMEDSLCPVVL